MKTKNIIIIALLATSLVFISSCTKDFDEMNVNPNAATSVPATNVFGNAILIATNNILGSNLPGGQYASAWCGHLSNTSYPEYQYRVNINNNHFKNMYKAMSQFMDVMRLAEEAENDNLYAASLTMKAYVAQKTVDNWGKIPYSEAFKLSDGIIYPRYDTEKEVYDAILDELSRASGMFDAEGGDIGEGDFILKGDIDKWIKFCNSTRLRVAMRMTGGDLETGSAVISEILGNSSAYPILETNEENIYMWWPGIPPDEEYWYRTAGAPGGIKSSGMRMNHTLIQALKDLNDPRLPVYADVNQWGEYNGYKYGPDQLYDTSNVAPNVSHIGDRFANNAQGFSPYMHCAEVYFLKAEAFERSFNAGDARAAYEMGISKSLEENGIETAAIAAYLAEPEVAWGEGTTSNLDKIYMQKWISLFKQGLEAWAENRRTDVPEITDIEVDYAGSHNRPPLRMSYADEELALNVNFPTDIVITDIFYGTKIWWDKRSDVH